MRDSNVNMRKDFGKMLSGWHNRINNPRFDSPTSSSWIQQPNWLDPVAGLNSNTVGNPNERSTLSPFIDECWDYGDDRTIVSNDRDYSMLDVEKLINKLAGYNIDHMVPFQKANSDAHTRQEFWWNSGDLIRNIDPSLHGQPITKSKDRYEIFKSQALSDADNLVKAFNDQKNITIRNWPSEITLKTTHDLSAPLQYSNSILIQDHIDPIVDCCLSGINFEDIKRSLTSITKYDGKLYDRVFVSLCHILGLLPREILEIRKNVRKILEDQSAVFEDPDITINAVNALDLHSDKFVADDFYGAKHFGIHAPTYNKKASLKVGGDASPSLERVNEIFKVVHVDENHVIVSPLRPFLNTWYRDMTINKNFSESRYEEHNLSKIDHAGDPLDEATRGLSYNVDWDQVMHRVDKAPHAGILPNIITADNRVLDTEHCLAMNDDIIPSDKWIGVMFNNRSGQSRGELGNSLHDDLGLDPLESGALFVINKSMICPFYEQRTKDGKLRFHSDVLKGDLIFLGSSGEVMKELPLIKAIHGENGVYDLIKIGGQKNVKLVHHSNSIPDEYFDENLSDAMDARVMMEQDYREMVHQEFTDRVCSMSFNTKVSAKPTQFIPTHKDSRSPIRVDNSNGKRIAFTESLRCELCNGRVIVHLPQDHGQKPIQCGHCKKGMISTKHLVYGAKVKEYFPPRGVYNSNYSERN